MTSILPADLRVVMGETFAGRGEVVVDHCKMIVERRVRILLHAIEQFGFLHLKPRDALPHGGDSVSEVRRFHRSAAGFLDHQDGQGYI
jgi:hypothetical protein